MYTPSEFAEKVGVTVHTLQRWDREGRLIAKRTHTNRRYYTDDDLQKVLGTSPEKARLSVVYCRVSSQAQKPDLKNQREMLEQFCAASSRLYGLRNYRKALKKALEDDTRSPD
jgi:predicted site-specific integrase-resolvase